MILVIFYPKLPALSSNPLCFLGRFPRSGALAPLRAMEPGQPYQRDEALLEELGYKTGQKASDPGDGRSR